MPSVSILSVSFLCSFVGCSHSSWPSASIWHLAPCSSKPGKFTSSSYAHLCSTHCSSTRTFQNTKQLHIRRVSRGILLSVVGALLVVEACVTAAWVLTDAPRAVLM